MSRSNASQLCFNCDGRSTVVGASSPLSGPRPRPILPFNMNGRYYLALGLAEQVGRGGGGGHLPATYLLQPTACHIPATACHIPAHPHPASNTPAPSLTVGHSRPLQPLQPCAHYPYHTPALTLTSNEQDRDHCSHTCTHPTCPLTSLPCLPALPYQNPITSLFHSLSCPVFQGGILLYDISQPEAPGLDPEP